MRPSHAHAWGVGMAPGARQVTSTSEGKVKVFARALFGIVVIGCGYVAVANGADPAITVAVQGVRVVAPPPGEDDGLRAFNDNPGTAVALIITDPQKRLVAFDVYASHLKSFVDDKGKDLTKCEPETKTDTDMPATSPFGVMFFLYSSYFIVISFSSLGYILIIFIFLNINCLHFQ